MKRIALITTTIALLLTFVLMTSQGMCATAKNKELAGQLNINTATAEELQLLPKVGPKIAERIVAYRSANGPFKVSEDLKNVKGIGEKTFSRLSSYIKISGKSDLHLAS